MKLIPRRILAAVALLCLIAPAYAQKTKAALNAEISANIFDNNVMGVTPALVRSSSLDIVNSIMPASPVVSGNLACFNGTTGLLQDCGTSPSQIALGLVVLAPSALATTTVLPNTPTYNNGTLGVGATLTSASNTTLTVDGTAATLNTVVLVKNQSSAFQNGIYTVSQAGSGSVPWILTRATYFDQASEMTAGSYTFVTGGTANANSAYFLQTTVTTVGTDPLNWALFSQANVNAVSGGGASVIGDLPIMANTSNTSIADSGFSASQIPGVIPSTATVTITAGSPTIINWTGHGLSANATVYFTTTGSLPTGLTASNPALSSPTAYYVIGSSITTNSFEVASTMANARAGIAVNTSGSQSGTQTATANAVACAGCIGEYVYQVVPVSPGFPITGTGTIDFVWNSINLTAGIWQVGGNVGVTGTSSGTIFDTFHADTGNATTNIQTAPGMGSTTAFHLTSNNSNGYIFPQGQRVFALTSPATINAVMEPAFSGGTAVAYGVTWALRIH